MLPRGWHKWPPEVIFAHKMRQLRYIDNNFQYPQLHSYILLNCNLFEMHLLSVIRGHEKIKGLCCANMKLLAERLGCTLNGYMSASFHRLQDLNLLYVNKIVARGFRYTWRVTPWGVHMYEKRWMRKRSDRMPPKVIGEFCDFVENLKIMCS